MSAPGDRQSGNEPKDTLRTSMRLSRHEDDDEEEYDLSAMGISDGFRPLNGSVSHNRMSSRTLQRDSTGRRTPPPRPSSTTKPRGLDSFALRHDGSMGAAASRPAIPSTHALEHSITRSSSASTETPYVMAESPYQGPIGPSHPYHMYPQGTRPTRTASVATTSTFQPSERQYSGPQGPAHPYGMYPQNTTAETDTSEPIAAIPVGFPGRRDDYQRRLGPEGEEAGDIIGPLGHTEQLPPYSQYPTEAFGKARVAPALAGAGGIGLATRNPEFASREDLSIPQSRQSTRSLASDASTHQVNTAAFGDSEKPSEKRWKVIAQRKACGIVPVWAFVLVGIVCVLFSVVLGTVLGVLTHRHHSPPPHHTGYITGAAGSDYAASETVYATVTTTLDASALTASPTGIPTLPTGQFALPIFTPFSQQQTCLDSSDLYAAWSCALPMNMLEVCVSSINGSGNSPTDNKISIKKNNNTLETWFYGSQPPHIEAEQNMNLVKDLEQSQLGPAWFFQVPYNKVVVVPENTFNPSSNKKRNHYPFDGSFVRKGIAQPGEKPWFCYWNGTLLETFIYVNNTSSSTAASPTSTSQYSAKKRSPDAEYTSQDSTTASASTATTTGGYTEPSFLPLYPKIIKVEERRIPNSPKPYCDQMEIQPDGTAEYNLDSDNNVVRIYLNETEPVYQPPSKRSDVEYLDSSNGDLVERQSTQQCTCVWLTS